MRDTNRKKHEYFKSLGLHRVGTKPFAEHNEIMLYTSARIFCIRQNDDYIIIVK